MDDDRFVIGEIFLILLIGIVAIVFVAVSSKNDGFSNNDSRILATQISALHADVHALQTQIAGKQ